MPCRGGVCTPKAKPQQRPSVAQVAQQQGNPVNPGLLPTPQLTNPGMTMPTGPSGIPQQQGNYSMSPITYTDPAKSGWDAFKSYFTGEPGKTQFFPTYQPNQQSVLDMLLGMGTQGLQQNPFNFQPIEDRARKQFTEQTIPSLAERFTALGTGGSQRSSAFTGRLGAAASDLESQLAELRAKYGLLGQQNALSQLQLGLSPRFENAYFPRQSGALQNAATGLGQGAGFLGSLLTKSLFGL